MQLLTVGQHSLQLTEHTSVLTHNALVHIYSNGALGPVISILASVRSNLLGFCRQLSNILRTELDCSTKLGIVFDDGVVRVCSMTELVRELELLCAHPDQ